MKAEEKQSVKQKINKNVRYGFFEKKPVATDAMKFTVHYSIILI